MTDLSVISQDGVAASTGQAEASATRSPLLADPPGQSQSHPESEPFKRGPGPEAGKGVKPAHPEAGPKGPNPSADGSPPSLGPAFNRPDDLFAGLTGQVPRLPQGLHGLQNGLRQAADTSRIRIPLNYLALIEAPGDPIWLQSVPHPAEWEARESGADRGIQPGRDPLAEDRPEHSPVPHLTIRYPDRALLQVTGLCPMYCRFCMRKRKTLQGEAILPRAVDAALEALAHHPAVREVILSGGDPLMVPDNRLLSIARRALAVPHVRSLRIHTRMACMAPERITPELVRGLGGLGAGVGKDPVWMALHFNHPRELTGPASAAVTRLRRGGIPLLSQTVLLKGVNDHPQVLAELYQGLIRLGVHPYYLHHPDWIEGTDHFRLSVSRGLEIVAGLRRLMPELVMLHYVLDTPGGGGKIPLSLPDGGTNPDGEEEAGAETARP